MRQVTSAGSMLAGSKGLWVAVGVLGLAVVGLGGALYSTVASKPPVDVAVVSAPPVIASPLPALDDVPAADPAPTARARPVPTRKTQAPAAPVAVCADCATVVAVTPFEREQPASGAGAVAGGVLGAIVGNQVGNGSGRDVARVLGACGGGLAGHQVEKNMKKVQAYRVALRMDDDSRRTVEVDASVAVGERVRVDGQRLQPLPH